MNVRRLALCSLAAAGAAAVSAAVVAGSRPAGAHRGPLLGGLPAVPVSVTPATGPGSTIAPPTCVNSAGVTFRCYSPQLVQAAYDFPTGPGAPTGRGQTIVLVDAFGDPTIQSDLAAFDARWGIPAPPAFEIVGPNGTGDPADPDVQAWQRETALDVEWAHALAPGARIVLVVSANDADDVMNDAEGDALPRYPGAIVSHSFGSPETDDIPADAALHGILASAQRLGDTLVAATGDAGATFGTDAPVASYPASDPLVTAVGGTEGRPYPNGLLRGGGRYGGEEAWNEADTFDLATGGAPSVLFSAPSWQRGLSRFRTRTIPDVAFDAALDGGVLVVAGGSTLLMGGTSVGSPAWSAVFALADEARGGRGGIGFADSALYALAANRGSYGRDFHDVTDGTNKLDSPVGFRANGGYDLTTGLGTPDVANLLADLAGGASGRGEDTGAPAGTGHDTDRHRRPGR